MVLLEGIAAGTELLIFAHHEGFLDRLRNSFKKRHRILVLGTSGVGKTNFLSSLVLPLPSTIDYMDRTQFAQGWRVQIGDSPFLFVDTPGEDLHQTRRMDAIREALARGVDGVINVVSYGYHEGRSGKDIATENGHTREDFLEERRFYEISAVQEWAPLLGDRETANWLITVVTKADLWWNTRAEVLEYCERGTYAQNLGSAQQLRPVVLEYCSVLKRFYDEVPLSGEFDDRERIRARQRFFEHLLASLGSEKRES